jgi:hypothetical protein
MLRCIGSLQNFWSFMDETEHDRIALDQMVDPVGDEGLRR